MQFFGSIAVGDRVVSTDSALVLIDGVPGTQADLLAGNYVTVVGDLALNRADEVRYRSTLRGRVDAAIVVDPVLGESLITVLGQTVVLSAATRRHGAAAVQLGDFVEISGPVTLGGIVIATSVEALATLSDVKLVGTVSDAGADSFDVGMLTVDITNAVLSNFDGTGLADGQRVEVRGPLAGVTGQFAMAASTVELLPVPVVQGKPLLEVETVITGLGVSGFSLNAAGLALSVTTDAETLFAGGVEALLSLDAKVKVDGRVSNDGVLLADTVLFKRTQAIRAEGPVSSIDLEAMTAEVLGVTFTIRSETQLEDDSDAAVEPFTLADVMVGEWVEVRGFADGAATVATRFERDEPEDRAELRGPVTDADLESRTIEVAGVAITADDMTSFEDFDGMDVTEDEFHAALVVGRFIEARWDDFVALTDPADSFEAEEEDDD